MKKLFSFETAFWNRLNSHGNIKSGPKSITKPKVPVIPVRLK